MDILDYTKKFNDIEVKHNFFDRVDNLGLHYWDIVRHDVFNELYYHICNTNIKITSSPKSFICRSLELIKLFIGYLKFSIRVSNKYKYIVFCSARNAVNGNNLDIISQDILQIIGNDSLVIDLYTNRKNKSFYNSIFNYGLSIERLKNKIFRMHSSSKQFDVLTILNNEFSIESDFNEMVKNLIVDFKVTDHYYGKLFKKIQPKAVFFVQNGIQKGLVRAANNASISTIELQHGLIGYVHPAYSYPDIIRINSKKVIVPKYFFAFSDFWVQSVNFPVVETLSMGNNFYGRKKIKKKIQYNLLFISANIYINDIVEFTNLLFEKKYTGNVCIKLHPNQLNDWDYLVDLYKDNNNITIVSNQVTINDLLTVSEAVFAIQSTIVYEALHNDLKVLLYKIKDYKTHKDVFNHPNVYLIEDAEQLIEIVDKPVAFSDFEVFDTFNLNLFNSFINGKILYTHKG